MRTSKLSLALVAVAASSCLGVLAGCNGAAAAFDCPAGETDCGGYCVNLWRNPSHCGACDAACARDEVCSLGVCQAWCPVGTTACAGGCVDPVTDAANCGACGAACADGECCYNGGCAPCASPTVPGDVHGRRTGSSPGAPYDENVPTPSGRGLPHVPHAATF